MNSESNLEYYVSDETLNPHIDNIISYKKFLESLLGEIKIDNYNKDMVKLLSRHIEKSLSEISNDTTLFDYSKKEENKFTPSVRVVTVNSDTSDSDVESDIYDYDTDDTKDTKDTNDTNDTNDAVGALSDDEASQLKKLQYYKSQMELYNPSGSFTKSNSLMVNDEPDFIDEPLYTINAVYNSYTKNNINSSNYDELDYETKSSDYSHSRDIHYSPIHVQSHEHFLKRNDKESCLNKDSLEEKLDYYSRFTKQLESTNSTKQVESTNSTKQVESTSSTKQVEELKSKFKDKLANEFLNNNLELDKYHYLKSFNLDRINNYCNSVNIF